MDTVAMEQIVVLEEPPLTQTSLVWQEGRHPDARQRHCPSRAGLLAERVRMALDRGSSSGCGSRSRSPIRKTPVTGVALSSEAVPDDSVAAGSKCDSHPAHVTRNKQNDAPSTGETSGLARTSMLSNTIVSQWVREKIGNPDDEEDEDLLQASLLLERELSETQPAVVVPSGGKGGDPVMSDPTVVQRPCPRSWPPAWARQFAISGNPAQGVYASLSEGARAELSVFPVGVQRSLLEACVSLPHFWHSPEEELRRAMRQTTLLFASANVVPH